MADGQGVRPATVLASVGFAVAVAVPVVAIAVAVAVVAAAFPVTDFSLRHFGVRQPGRHAGIDRVVFLVESRSIQINKNNSKNEKRKEKKRRPG